MASSSDRAARSRWGAEAGAGWGQAQQQHRMTPLHMEPMCMQNAAVVEDMALVEHDVGGVVHGEGRASRNPGRDRIEVNAPGVPGAFTSTERGMGGQGALECCCTRAVYAAALGLGVRAKVSRSTSWRPSADS